MANFKLGSSNESAVRVYDNQGAYNTLQAMMNRKEQLTVKFYGSKDNSIRSPVQRTSRIYKRNSALLQRKDNVQNQAYRRDIELLT